jgi:hypothetical protein
VAPRDLALSRPSPRGKKNSRGAAGLRQIKHANFSLTQVRHDVIGCVPNVAVRTAGTRPAKAQLANADSGREQWRARQAGNAFPGEHERYGKRSLPLCQGVMKRPFPVATGRRPDREEIS